MAGTVLETDPICFARDSDGDVAFPLRLASGFEAAAIGARTRLKIIQGEWFLDVRVGVEWLEGNGVDPSAAILGQPFDAGKTRAAIIRELLTVPGARDVTLLRLRFDRATRELVATFRLRMSFGDTPVDAIALEVA